MAEVDFECSECNNHVLLVWGEVEIGGSKKTISCTNCGQRFVFEYSLWMELSRPKYKDRDWLKSMYEDEGLSMEAIGKMCGRTAMTIREWLIKHDIERRGKGERRR